MSFQSPEFAGFLAIALLFYYIVPQKLRKWVLLLENAAFFLWADLSAGIWLGLSIVSTWVAALLCQNTARRKTGKKEEEDRDGKSVRASWCGRLMLIGCLICNLGLLACFQYLPVWDRLINAAYGQGLRVVHLDPAGRLGLVAPVGISFYTLQAAGYLLDVYRGKYEPEKNLAKYAIFVSFFPNLASGPIERGDHFLPQLEQVLQAKRRSLLDYDRMAQGLISVLYGFFLKMVIADRAGILVDHLYGMYEFGNSFTMLCAMLFYSVQIYCDFASYSCIATGIAQMMGFTLADNFRQPYFAVGISDFWRRWHISLSGWLKDYVYIPMGGNRRGVLRRYQNLLAVFLVSGLWHGGAPQFLVWGFGHGLCQVAEDLCRRLVRACRFAGRKRDGQKASAEDGQHVRRSLMRRAGKICGGVWRWFARLCTFFTVSLLWIFFRSDSVDMAMVCIRNLFTGWQGFFYWKEFLFAMGLDRVQMLLLLAFVGVLLLLDGISERTKKRTCRWIYEARLPLRWGICLGLLLSVFLFGQYGPGFDASGFIYANF